MLFGRRRPPTCDPVPSVSVPVREPELDGNHAVPESGPEHRHEVEQRTQLRR